MHITKKKAVMVVPLRRYACTQARGVTLAPRLVALRVHPGFWRYACTQARGIMLARRLVALVLLTPRRHIHSLVTNVLINL